MEWSEEQIEDLSDRDRLAWLASAVGWLAAHYYGRSDIAPQSVGGDDI